MATRTRSAAGSLREYWKKRNFGKTVEPRGRQSRRRPRALQFVIQKHDATRLHFDLRLELDGVMKSWAVPKGPSRDPAARRLAMHVEDHPIEYGMFEGVIPSGYGAGIVMLWDKGTWTPETDDVEAALQKGDLKFTLDGYKLKGSWVLVKTRGFGGAENSWLLIKHRDDWAGPINITEFAPLSVKTPNADFAEILSDKTPALWLSNAPAKGGDTGAMFKKIIERALSMKAPASTNTKNTKGTKAKPSKAKAKKKKA